MRGLRFLVIIQLRKILFTQLETGKTKLVAAINVAMRKTSDFECIFRKPHRDFAVPLTKRRKITMMILIGGGIGKMEDKILY